MPLLSLDDITQDDQPRAGDKAYNCARLKRAGVNVPDGIVLLAGASEAEIASAARHPWFDQLAGDARFAVRSSGIDEDGEDQSFAGIHQTLLDVKRADVPNAVRRCIESARSPQALEYRRARKMPIDAIQIAVLIQRMVHPVAAGVAFTIHPVTGAAWEIVINSSWGVGEALVSGQVDPDEFIVRKADGELIWSRLGGKSDGRDDVASLTPAQLTELSGLLVRIEEHYQAPQDVEWCHDGSKFSIVQSRPITAVPTANQSDTEWTRANLAEVLPDLTSPQALAAFEPMLNSAERGYLGGLMAPESTVGPVVRVFYGRLYFNLSQLRHICKITGQVPADLLRSMGHAEAIHPGDEVAARPSVRQLLSIVPDLARIVWRHLRVAKIVRDQEHLMREHLDRLTAIQVRSLTDEEIVSEMDTWLERAPETMETVFLLAGVLVHEVPIRRICQRVGFQYERLVYPQMAVGKRSVSVQQAFDLTALADVARHEPRAVSVLADHTATLSRMRTELQGTKFLDAFEQFLRNYGHRGRFESDWAIPRYAEDPAPLLFVIRAHIESGGESQAADTQRRLQQASEQAWAAFIGRLSRWQKLVTLPRVRKGVQLIKQYYIWRERVRSDMIKVLAAMRVWHLTLAGRFVERGWIDHRDDYFMLRPDDIGPVVRRQRDPATLRNVVATRHAELARYRAIRMPLLMRESELPHLIRTAGISVRAPEAGDLTGFPVSTGSVEAEVVVIRDPADFARMKRGAILVATATDPSWTPLFTLASGVIVEVGGVLSHASTIAREYGLPAVANVKDATRILRTGDRVRLDAVNGIIHRIRRDDAAGTVR